MELSTTNTAAEELHLKIKNRNSGIRDYLDNLNRSQGRLYMTPKGPYSVMKEVEEDFNTYRRTISRRFMSKSVRFAEWYVITGDTPLQPEETCKYCDTVDDKLFSLGCWMTRIRHTHDTRIQGRDMIEYLFKGTQFEISYGEFMRGIYPHTGFAGGMRAFQETTRQVIETCGRIPDIKFKRIGESDVL